MSQPEGIERFGYKQELRRSIGFADLVFYGLIFMVPIAPFGIFGDAFQVSGGMVPLAYAVALGALVFTAWSYAQMSRSFPTTGGVYNYAGRGIGAPVGFLAGWMILLDYMLVPSLLYVIASFAMTAVASSVAALAWIPAWGWLLIFIGLNTIVNTTGMKITLRTTRIFIVGELAVLAAFMVMGVSAIASGKAEFSFAPLFDPDVFSWELILAAASITVLSFLGFDGIALLSEENRGDARKIGRAMTLALGIAGLLFIAQTWLASMLVADPEALLAADRGAAGEAGVAANSLLDNAFYATAEVAGGQWLFMLCAAATAIAWGFADSMVAQVASSRLMYAMARDRQLPRFLARISTRFGVPTNAILLTSAISVVIGLYVVDSGRIGELVALVNFGAICSFLALHLAVIWHFVFRKRSRQWIAHLVMPLCGLAVLGSVAYFTSASAQLLGVGWLGLGVIILIGLYVAGRRPRLPDPVGQTPEPEPQPAGSPR